MTGDILLLKYELELIKPEGFPPVHSDQMECQAFDEMMRDVLYNNGLGSLEIHVHNGSHHCLTVTFSAGTCETDKEMMADESPDCWEEWEKFDQSLIDKVIAELQAYERQEFIYREIMI